MGARLIMYELIFNFTTKLSSVLWGPGTMAAFLLTGIIISFKTRFFQITGAKTWLKATIASTHEKDVRETGEKGSLTQLQAICASLAACVGTGNIIGVATAIKGGGAGAVFWMLAASIPGMMTSCAENILGIMYRVRTGKGEWLGGPMCYLENGLKAKRLAIVYAFLCVFSSFGIGNMTQSNSAARSLTEGFGISPVLTAAALSVLTAAVIFGGIQRIARASERLVPVACMIYITAATAVIAFNAKRLPAAISDVFHGALNLKAMRYGISRGVFSNEAGLGTASLIHSNVHAAGPARQGMWGIFGVFIDTPVMCTLTALVILCSGAYTQGCTADAATLTQTSFGTVFGDIGSGFISICLLVFGFATIIGWCCCGEKAVEYIFPSGSKRVYRTAYTTAVFAGAVLSLELVWSLSDIFNALMAFPNLIGLCMLSAKAANQLKSELASSKNNSIEMVSRLV